MIFSKASSKKVLTKITARVIVIAAGTTKCAIRERMYWRGSVPDEAHNVRPIEGTMTVKKAMTPPCVGW